MAPYRLPAPASGKRSVPPWLMWTGLVGLGILACTAVCAGVALFLDLPGGSDSSQDASATSTSGPAWSPDGSRIAFAADFDDYGSISFIDPDGANMNQVTRHPFRISDLLHNPADVEPAWSPDGSRIVFSSSRGGLRLPYDMPIYHIFAVNADGSHLTQLTDKNSIAEAGAQNHPAWSPDSSRILFTHRYEDWTLHEANIFVMNADGSNVTQLTNTPSWKGKATWSPDGRQIAFDALHNGKSDLFIMDSNGANVQPLIDSPYEERDPAWSPEGQQIAFVSDRESENWQVFIMHLDRSEVVQVTKLTSSYLAQSPAWSPDGKYLAFTVVSVDTFSASIYVIKTDGTQQVKLTGK